MFQTHATFYENPLFKPVANAFENIAEAGNVSISDIKSEVKYTHPRGVSKHAGSKWSK